ncbi:MAG: hypothetical protein AAF320_05120, partial [Myxococcota bacterium]
PFGKKKKIINSVKEMFQDMLGTKEIVKVIYSEGKNEFFQKMEKMCFDALEELKKNSEAKQYIAEMESIAKERNLPAVSRSIYDLDNYSNVVSFVAADVLALKGNLLSMKYEIEGKDLLEGILEQINKEEWDDALSNMKRVTSLVVRKNVDTSPKKILEKLQHLNACL